MHEDDVLRCHAKAPRSRDDDGCGGGARVCADRGPTSEHLYGKGASAAAHAVAGTLREPTGGETAPEFEASRHEATGGQSRPRTGLCLICLI